MFARNVPWIKKYFGSIGKYYYIWKFMIDEKYQGNGYGKEAMIEALNMIRSFKSDNIEYCFISYEAENTVARNLYLSFGFVEKPELYENLGEMPAVLKL